MIFFIKLFYFIFLIRVISCEIYFCASCTSSSVKKYHRKTKCICSPPDLLTSNKKVCLFSHNSRICKGYLGNCCNSTSTLCPLCSKNEFTRNNECNCDELDLIRKNMTKPINEDSMDAVFCCDDVTPMVKTTEPPTVRKMIKPLTRIKWIKAKK